MSKSIAVNFFLVVLLGCNNLLNYRIQDIDSQVQYPEGPIWHEGNLFYVSYGQDKIFRRKEKTISVFWKNNENPPKRCGPASQIIRENRNLLVSCYDSNALVEISPEGEKIHEYKLDGKKSHIGPNDFVKDKSGGIYFSVSGVFDEKAPASGKILYLTKGDVIQEAIATNVFHYSNGLALSQDEKKILVSEHLRNRVIELDVIENGKLASPRVFSDLSRFPVKSNSLKLGPDGIKIGPKSGNIYVCQYGGSRILVLDEKGELKKNIQLPISFVTNLTFESQNEKILYVTAETNADSPTSAYNGRVYKLILD
ncbi:MAG: SMP-30/gluconolactonase/LRE family protein [Leptospiraceae bacterium]|nr:SMP-30/gluconolactonase/LRE family protein [Leptospiraceae bacterium]